MDYIYLYKKFNFTCMEDKLLQACRDDNLIAVRLCLIHVDNITPALKLCGELGYVHLIKIINGTRAPPFEAFQSACQHNMQIPAIEIYNEFWNNPPPINLLVCAMNNDCTRVVDYFIYHGVSEIAFAMILASPLSRKMNDFMEMKLQHKANDLFQWRCFQGDEYFIRNHAKETFLTKKDTAIASAAWAGNIRLCKKWINGDTWSECLWEDILTGASYSGNKELITYALKYCNVIYDALLVAKSNDIFDFLISRATDADKLVPSILSREAEFPREFPPEWEIKRRACVHYLYGEYWKSFVCKLKLIVPNMF